MLFQCSPSETWKMMIVSAFSEKYSASLLVIPVVRYSKLKKAKGWQTCVAKVGKVKGADYDYGDDVDTDGTTVDYFGDDDDNEDYEYDDEEYEYADDDDDGEYSGDDDG